MENPRNCESNETEKPDLSEITDISGKILTSKRKTKNMLGINESATAYDLAELLQDETGIFEAISPNGEKYQVVSRAGQSIANFRASSHPKGSGQRQQNQTWRVRKIGELRSEQETR